MNMELQVGVKVLLRNEDGAFLLIRRSPEKYGSDKWDIPGGRIDPGSELLKNLVREVKEETGLDMTSIPKLIAAQDIMASETRHVVRLTYLGSAQGEPQLSDEHTEYKWVLLARMKKLANLDSYLKRLLEDGTIAKASRVRASRSAQLRSA